MEFRAMRSVPQGKDAVLVCDLDERVTYLNEQASILFDVPVRDGVGRSLLQVMHQPFESQEMATARQLLKERGEWTGKITWRGSDGARVAVESSWALVRDGNDIPLSILVVSRNITSDATQQREVQDRRRTECLGALAVGIAHHLNDVFAPVILEAERIAREPAEAARRRLLRSMSDRLRNGADLVSQILTFASRESAPSDPVHPALLVRSLEGMLQTTMPKSITVKTEIENPLGSISVDGAILFQILLDLCLRARECMGGAGTMTISAQNVPIDRQLSHMLRLRQPGDYILFSVSTARTRRTERPFNGIELKDGRMIEGLRQLADDVESLQGVLKVRKGSGSEIEYLILLSAAPADVERRSDHSREEPPGSGEVVLVVDDEPAIRESTKMTLAMNGYKVITAGDGAEAVSLYAQHVHEIAAVLIDIMMPHMSGDTAIRAMIQINPSVRVIATSGYATKEKLSHILDLERVALIQKPYTAETLLAALGRILGVAIRPEKGGHAAVHR